MSNSKVQVLLSCMTKDPKELVLRSKITGPVVVINQTDSNERIVDGNILIINTTERGLSKSRNMAVRNGSCSICMLCDDDEIFDSDYQEKIINAYESIPDADVIAFEIRDAGKDYPTRLRKINYLTALKISSWQISFRRESVVKNNIFFDETVGSGVSKGGGEENIFLYDCLHSKLKVYFVPVEIGRMIEGKSKWFFGYTKEYFYDRGKFTRKMMGVVPAFAYGIYFVIFKNHIYSKNIPFATALHYLLKGIFS